MIPKRQQTLVSLAEMQVHTSGLFHVFHIVLYVGRIVDSLDDVLHAPTSKARSRRHPHAHVHQVGFQFCQLSSGVLRQLRGTAKQLIEISDFLGLAVPARASGVTNSEKSALARRGTKNKRPAAG